MLPKGWDDYLLGDIATFRNGLNFTKSDSGEVIKIVGVADFKARTKLENTNELESIQVATRVRDLDLLASGDLLFVRSNGNKELIGRCLYFPHVSERLSFSGFTIRGRVDASVLEPEFASYLMRSKVVTDQIFLGGSGTNISNLSQEILSNIEVKIPALPEQRRISKVLNTWDQAIIIAEHLLANSRKQKRGLMNELLFGRTKMQRFTAPWAQVQIGEVLKEVKRRVEWDDKALYPLISVRRRSGGAFHRETLLGSEILTKKLNHAYTGEFLISKMQVVHGAMAVVPNCLNGMYVSDSYLVFQSSDESRYNIHFIGWLSATQWMYRAALRSSYGVHIEKMTFDLGMFFGERIRIPTDIEEQQAICNVLNDAQSEIEAAERHLEKMKEEKAAMMAQLLTGKRRVRLPPALTEAHA